MPSVQGKLVKHLVKRYLQKIHQYVPLPVACVVVARTKNTPKLRNPVATVCLWVVVSGHLHKIAPRFVYGLGVKFK